MQLLAQSLKFKSAINREWVDRFKKTIQDFTFSSNQTNVQNFKETGKLAIQSVVPLGME